MKDLNVDIIELLKSKNVDIDELELLHELSKLFESYDIKRKEVLQGENDVFDKIDKFLYCKKIEGFSDSSSRNYKNVLYQFAKSTNKSIANITSEDIREYIYIKSKKNKNITAETALQCIKSFFKWLYLEGYIKQNVSRKVILPTKRNRLKPYLTNSDVEILRSNCKEKRTRALLEFILSTGASTGELEGLKVSDIKDGVIKVKSNGNKQDGYMLVNDTAKHYLNIYLNSKDYQSEYLFDSKRSPHDFLQSRAIQSDLKTLESKTGVKFSPRLLRNTAAMILYQRGADIAYIQKYMRISSIAILDYFTVPQVDLKEIHNKKLHI